MSKITILPKPLKQKANEFIDSPRKAEMLIDGHQNITDNTFDAVKHALEYYYNLRRTRQI